jgi:hypothetical protein
MSELKQKPERGWKSQAKSKEAPAEEKAAAQQHERPDIALLMAIKAGGYEQPQLPKHVRRGQEEPRYNGELDVEVERVRGVQIGELFQASPGS